MCQLEFKDGNDLIGVAEFFIAREDSKEAMVRAFLNKLPEEYHKFPFLYCSYLAVKPSVRSSRSVELMQEVVKHSPGIEVFEALPVQGGMFHEEANTWLIPNDKKKLQKMWSRLGYKLIEGTDIMIGTFKYQRTEV